MFEQSASVARLSAAVPVPAVASSSHLIGMRETSHRTERLPFSVRVVRDDADLAKAVGIRHAAYARHVPDFADKLREPEAADFEAGVVVLLAESKLDGSALGTMRIQSNCYRPLSLEQSVELPATMCQTALAEVTRLGVTGDRIGHMVKTVLVKASFQYCQLMGIDWAIIAARSPLDRQYERLLFEDVFPGQGYIAMRHANNLPHRVLGFDIHTGQARWTQARHPLLDFMCYTYHPDIELGELPVDAIASLSSPFLNSGDRRPMTIRH